MFKFYLVLISIFISSIHAKVVFIPNFQIEKCPEYKSKEANVIDTSEMEIHIENDTHAFFNGLLKFTGSIPTAPIRISTERYERGHWITQVFDRKYEDMCISAHDTTQPFYPNLDSIPDCPLKAGTSWPVNMVQFSLPDFLLANLPHHYCGQWRGTVIAEFVVDGETKFDCRRVYGDIFDDGKSKGLGNIVG